MAEGVEFVEIGNNNYVIHMIRQSVNNLLYLAQIRM